MSGLEFTRAPGVLSVTGLLGWVRVTLNGRLGLDGLAVRRTAEGELVLTFPSRRDGRGREHPILWPVDDAVRRDFQDRVLDELVAKGDLS